MKNKRNRNIVWILVGFLAILAVAIFGYRFLSLRVQANVIHPQILIHKPFNQQEIDSDDGTFIHATARSETGIKRIEVWVDGAFYDAQEAPDGEPITPFVLHTFWQPAGIGLHKIVIRAYDANNTEGIASALVTASHSPGSTSPPVDPTGIIAAGQYPEEAQISSGGDSQSASDSSGGSSAPAPDYSPADSAPPPPAEEVAPPMALPSIQFMFLHLFDFFGTEEEDDNVPDPNESLFLKLEALELETGIGYEGVHCYVGVADRTPVWYPDTDANPETDENFSSIGEGQWNIADYLANDHGVIAYWPGDTPLPFEINCVGYAGGGTEAYDLGGVNVNVPPSEWDGITHQISTSAEGSFTLTYRISIEEPVPLALNPDMPAPFNLQIDERRQELSWDWAPSDEAPDLHPNFLVFVNDILVFRTTHINRTVRLPYMWFSPPCDTNYRFNVVAYITPYPEGDYSVPSAPAYLPSLDDEPRTDCSPQFLISFDTLVTGDLGGDDIPNNWANQVEPVHGSFFANDKSVEFFNQTLLPNYNYPMSTLVEPNSMTHVVYEIQEGEVLRIGFDLIDYDDGNNELLCTNNVFHDYSYNMLMEYGYFEDTIASDENDGTRCRVHYTIRPLGGSAFGLAYEGSLPLPWVDITGLRINLGTGNLMVDARNVGSAEWANQPLTLKVIRRGSGDTIGTYLEDTFLDIGQEKTYATDIAVSKLGNICVVVDPNDQVLELYENTGALQHTSMQYCLPRPDLLIGEIQFNHDTGILRVEIRNQGESSSNIISTGSTVNVKDIHLLLQTDAPEGVDLITYVGQFQDEILTHHDSTWVEWSLPIDALEWINYGYTVTVDPTNMFVETDETNNSYSVSPGKDIRVAWDGIYARWYPNILQECNNWGRWANNDIEVWVEVYARNEASNRHIGSWHWEGDIGDTYDIAEYTGYHPWDASNHLMDFFINGDENLAFEIRGEQDNDAMGSATGNFYHWNDWDIMKTVGETLNDCDETDNTNLGYRILAYPGNSRWSYCGGWGIYVNICEVNMQNP